MPGKWLEQKITDKDLAVMLLHLRRQSKGWRQFIAPTGSLIISGLLALWILSDFTSYHSFGNNSIGHAIFPGIISFGLVIVILSIPNQSGRVISDEIERKTFEPLALTALKSSEIIDQKVAASVLDIAAFFIPTALVALAAWIAGGVTLIQVIGGYIVLYITMVTLGYLGVMISCYFTKSSTATAIAFFIPIAGSIFFSWTDIVHWEEWLLPLAQPGIIAMAAVMPAVILFVIYKLLVLWRRKGSNQISYKKQAPAWILSWAVLTACFICIPSATQTAARLCIVSAEWFTTYALPHRALEGLDGFNSANGLRGDVSIFAFLGMVIIWIAAAFCFRNKAILRLNYLRKGGYAK